MERHKHSGWFKKVPWKPWEVEAVAEAIVEDLRKDTILTVDQFRKRHGVQRDLVRAACKLPGTGIVYLTRWVRPLANSERRIRAELMHLGESPKPSTIPHLLGIAEMRTALADDLRSWSPQYHDPRRYRVRFGHPDVLGQDAEGNLVAVEYDAGRYTREYIVAKDHQLRAPASRRIWGTPGLRRALSIARLLPRAEVWQISWETGTHVLVQKNGELLVDPRRIENSQEPDLVWASPG
jgi:hypothetical protein